MTAPGLDHQPSTADHQLPKECLAELEAERAALSVALRAEARRRCGFKRGEDELIKRPDGSYDAMAVKRETHFECFHCGEKWHDDGEFGRTRVGLDESSHYVASNPGADECDVGFNIPQWINRRIRWGAVMLEKLIAQKVAQELGNFQRLKQWWQKVAARTWTNDLMSKAPERIGASLYDDKAQLPGEKVRLASCDFQFEGTHMIYQSWAIGDGTAPRLLHYEWIKPPAGLDTDATKREWCKNRVRELNKLYIIEPQNFMIDAFHRPDLVREWAAEDAVFAAMRFGTKVEKKWVTYCLLMGDDRASYRWEHPGRKPTWERFKRKETVLVECIKAGQRIRIPVQHQLWSNPSIKEIAERWRDGNSAPRILVHERFLQDTSAEGFWAQMTSERKLPWKGRPGRMRYDNEGRPNHAWDGFNMIIVRMDQLEYLNHFGPPEAEEEQ